MKRAIVMVILVLGASPAWALRFMGPPTTDIEAGQVGLGFDWSHTQFDVRSNEGDFRRAVEADIYFTRLIFGVADGAEISGLFGISDMEERQENGFRSGNDFSWGVGTKINFGQSGPFDIGAAFQISSMYGHDTSGLTYADRVELDAYLLELAIGPSFKVGGICLYGGPFVHFIVGDIEARVGSSHDSIDVEEEESEFGGYLGVSGEIAANTNLGIEYHITNDSYAIGVGIVHRFGQPSRPRVRAGLRDLGSWSSVEQRKPTQYANRMKVKTDASGEPVKDAKGNFVFIPVDDADTFAQEK